MGAFQTVILKYNTYIKIKNTLYVYKLKLSTKQTLHRVFIFNKWLKNWINCRELWSEWLNFKHYNFHYLKKSENLAHNRCVTFEEARSKSERAWNARAAASFNFTHNPTLTFPFLKFCARPAQTPLSSVFHVISCNKKMVVIAERSSWLGYKHFEMINFASPGTSEIPPRRCVTAAFLEAAEGEAHHGWRRPPKTPRRTAYIL